MRFPKISFCLRGQPNTIHHTCKILEKCSKKKFLELGLPGVEIVNGVCRILMPDLPNCHIMKNPKMPRTNKILYKIPSYPIYPLGTPHSYPPYGGSMVNKTKISRVRPRFTFSLSRTRRSAVRSKRRCSHSVPLPRSSAGAQFLND